MPNNPTRRWRVHAPGTRVIIMAENDPRLRMIDPARDTALAEQILAALDGTTVCIRIGNEATGPARVAAASLAAMAARLFGRIDLEGDTDLPPNWWGLDDIGELVTQASALTGAASVPEAQKVTLSVGADGVDAADFGIGGDDYTARIARHPVPVTPETHCLGVHAAACLAISQVLGMALAPHGLRVVEIVKDYQLDLLSHRPSHRDPDATTVVDADCDGEPAVPFELVFAGTGSVGTSAVALTATALAPAYSSNPAPPGFTVSLVDLDSFDPTRNPFRYPALLGGETGPKAEAMAAKLCDAGLAAGGSTCTVGVWTVQRRQPGVHGLLVSSVDTITGRLEVADVLAQQTLSIGVSGLELHAQRERVDGASACPFCDYVDSAPDMTQAEVYVDMTGLPLARVLQLLDGDGLLCEDDAIAVAAAGKLPAGHAAGLKGQRLEDLMHRMYAEAAITEPSGQAAAAVAFPQVSWFAGVLAAVEVVKQIRGLPQLVGRVDADLGGPPPGVIRVMPSDPSGRCVCHSGARRDAYRRLYATNDDV